MLLISLVQIISLFLQQELAQYLEPEKSTEPYLDYLKLLHEIEEDYYHACGSW